jgi:hypothetical protein
MTVDSPSVLHELLTRDNLRRLIAEECIGDREPWKGGSRAKIDRHLRATARCIRRKADLDLHTEFDDYGSGYASYVEIIGWPSDGSETRSPAPGSVEYSGIQVWLSRLAPIAAYGFGRLYRHDNGGGGQGFLTADGLYDLPQPRWKQVEEGVQACLRKYGFHLLPADLANRELGFAGRIPTILTDPPYCVFDAVFYWED